MKDSTRKILFKVLAEKGLADKEDRQALIHDLTDGRTSSTKMISDAEAVQLIHLLAPQSDHAKGQGMRRKIIGMFRSMGRELDGPKGKVADMGKINAWCIQYGYLHKPLNAYKYAELPKLVNQVQAVYNSSIINKYES